MPELNADIPHFLADLRAEFLYDMQDHHGEYEEVCVFGVASIEGRALGFHCVTSRGAQVARVPIHAFVHRRHEPHLPLDFLQVWSCFSPNIAVLEFNWLAGLRCDVLLKDKTWATGTYMFTCDWWGNRFSEDAGDNGFKNAHMVALDCGCYAAQPNNRMRWHEPSFIVKPFPERPDYKTMTHTWSCEDKEKWRTSDDDRFYYEYEESNGE